MEDSKIAALEEKAASFCGTTIERVEPLQVVKYNPGQFFGAHHDTGVLFDDGSVEFPKNPPRRGEFSLCARDSARNSNQLTLEIIKSALRRERQCRFVHITAT